MTLDSFFQIFFAILAAILAAVGLVSFVNWIAMTTADEIERREKARKEQV